MKNIVLFAVLLFAPAVNASEAEQVGTSAPPSIKRDVPTAPLPTLKPAPVPVTGDPLREMPPRKLSKDSAIQMEFHGEFRTILGITNMPKRQE